MGATFSFSRVGYMFSPTSAIPMSREGRTAWIPQRLDARLTDNATPMPVVW